MTEPTPEYESTPDNAEPEQPEQPDTRERPDEPEQPEQPEAAEDVQQPADLPEADEAMGKVIEFRGSGDAGSLTLRPRQTKLDPEQKAALVAIGIDVANDPGVIPHLRAFMHMCQIRGLDPWAREAYLIGRGQGNNRKYTMQTGIDGYRKMASSTGRFIRVKEVLWTGQDDDPESWWRDERGVMRRVWWDQWPASKGYPGSAKVVIEHYDDAGNITETEAVADWSMYAPFTDEWTWHPSERGKKVYKTDPDTGERVQTLNDMWKKGYAHMLAKCAEALAYRKAFPARLSGIYTHEEMHRLDQAEQQRVATEQRAARAQAYRTATTPAVTPAAPASSVSEPIRPEPERGGDPVTVGAVLADVVNASASPEQRAEWVRAELAFQAEVLGHAPSKLAARAMRAARRNIEDLTADDLLPTVAGLRAAVADALRARGDVEDAAKYGALPDAAVLDVTAYLAGEPDDEPDEPEDDADTVDAEVVRDPDDWEPTDEELSADPRKPHRFIDHQGLCRVCEQFEDDVMHAV